LLKGIQGLFVCFSNGGPNSLRGDFKEKYSDIFKTSAPEQESQFSSQKIDRKFQSYYGYFTYTQEFTIGKL
jgi:hypothetical protein